MSLPLPFHDSPSSPNTALRPATYAVDDENRPRIGGVDMVALAREYGTPLYVLDEATVRVSARAYVETLKQCYAPAGSLPLYACKANMSLGLVRIMAQEGMGLDVVSGGELFTAVQAQFPMDRVLFNGNNKTLDELEMAIHHGVGRISVDNFHDLVLIDQVARAKQKTVDILLRITPGIECHTHDYIKTGQQDSKFGFDMSQLPQALERIQSDYRDTIRLRGLHAHIGSQIFAIKPYEDLVEVMLNIYYNIRAQYDGLVLDDLDLGGGLGVVYTPQDDPPSVQDVLQRVTAKLATYAQHLEYPLPRLLLEPGRSLVATAGVTLYTVGSLKNIPKVRKYVAVDGGMGDNIRPALYQAAYSAVLANKLGAPVEETVTVVGRYCESGDVLLSDVPMPCVESGDILMVFGTGAYNYTMSSQYNRFPRPAMVLVENGKTHTLIQRESYETLIQQDLIPSHLRAASEPASGGRA